MFILVISVASCSKTGGRFLNKERVSSPNKTEAGAVSGKKADKMDKEGDSIIKEEDAENYEKIVPQVGQYLGKYQINISSFNGVLNLLNDNGQLKATLTFTNWGKGSVEYLKKVSIKGTMISFTRSVPSISEMERIGSSRYIKQKFYGTFSKDGRTILGYMVEGGTETTWKGKR